MIRLNNIFSFTNVGPMTIEILPSIASYISINILKQPDRKILPHEFLISSGLIDSFSLVDLAIFIEDNFGVHIDDTELNAETFNTLDELVNIIKSRM